MNRRTTQRKHNGGLAGDMSGFDIATAPAATAAANNRDSARPTAPHPGGASGAGPISLSLGMVKATADFQSDDKAAAPSPPENTKLSLKETARRSGARVSAYTARFRKTHPVMLKYSQEWLRHSDLKKLNDDYLRDHDQVKFLRGLAASKNFGPLLKKYAADPALPTLVIEFLSGLTREVPPDLSAAAVDTLNEDKTVKRLLITVAATLGVPAAMLPGLANEPQKGPRPP